MKPELVILGLGGNDLLRGLPPEETRANLDAMVADIKGRGIDVLLMGMRSPPNLGGVFTTKFDSIYPDMARKYDVELVPFFLEPIYTNPKLFQRDRIHPTEEGIEILVGETVEDVEDALE